MEDVSIGQHDSRMKIATRNIILMMIGKMTSLLGAGIYTFAMGLYVLKTTGSGMGFATTLVCGSLPRMICGPIAGAVADRINRRWLVIGTDLLSSLTMLIMFILATIFGPSLLFIYVSAALLSILCKFLFCSINFIYSEFSRRRTYSKSECFKSNGGFFIKYFRADYRRSRIWFLFNSVVLFVK